MRPSAAEIESRTLLREARRALAEADTLPELAGLADRAEVARVAARKAKLSEEACLDWEEFSLDAQREAGKMLAGMDKHAGGRPAGTGVTVTRVSPPKLEDIGVSRNQSKRWQAVASLPDEDYEEYKEKARASGEITRAGAVRRAKESDRERSRQDNRALVDDVTPLEPAPDQRYQAIIIDPPWDWGDEGDADQFGRARPTYQTMSYGQLTELPVGEQADVNAHLYLWITNRSLPKGFALLDAWGFRYITMLTWCKPHFGMGNYYRGQTEHVLFGVRGSLPLLRHDRGTWFEAPRPGRHSGKPDLFYELVEECSPGPWLEMFSRSARPGWAAWGAEA